MGVKRCILGVLVALLLASSAQAGLAPKEKWWSQADLKVYMRIFPMKVGIKWRGNYWKVTSWKCLGAGQAYKNTWPAFNCNLRIHDLNLNTLEYETHRLAARFVVGGRNGGYWTNIHELTT